MAQWVRNLPANVETQETQETWVKKNPVNHELAVASIDKLVLLSVYCVAKAMAPHSSTLAWKIPWMEEPGC